MSRGLYAIVFFNELIRAERSDIIATAFGVQEADDRALCIVTDSSTNTGSGLQGIMLTFLAQ